MITASELGRLTARVKVAADPTFRKSDTVMPSVSGSSAPKPSVAPYAPNPKSGPGGGKENWDYEPKKPNAVLPKMPAAAPTPTSSNANETTSQRLKKLRESLSDAAPASPAAKFEFDRAMKKIPEPAVPPVAPPAAPPAAPPVDNRPAVPTPSQPSEDWYETWRDDLRQKMSKQPLKIKYPDHTRVTAEEMAGYPSARSVEMRLLHDRQTDFERLKRNLKNNPVFDQNLGSNVWNDTIYGNYENQNGVLQNTPALLGGLAASITGNPVAGAQLVAGAASNINNTVRNLRTNLTDPVFSSQEIQKELIKKMQERLAENDRYHALEKFVEYPDQTELQKLHAMPARTPPVFPTAEFSRPLNLNTRSRFGLNPFQNPVDERGYSFAGPDGIPVGGRPFLDKEKNETSDNRKALMEKEKKIRLETQPYLPDLKVNLLGNVTPRRAYIHPDMEYLAENASTVRGLARQPESQGNIFLPNYADSNIDNNSAGLLNTRERLPKWYVDDILEAHRQGRYPTRAEREFAKQKLIPQELADPNTAHGSAQRVRRMLYDPTDEGINIDVIPPDVLRRNDPVEIRYYAQKAKMMQGR
jgi:hypothetical protein